jgi:predicted alternative tryptophan synthase beta-subunit
MACAHFGLDLTVFMVKVSFEQKPFRKGVMETFGANIIPSPSNTTEVGKMMLAKDPTSGGSLGCAISEAIEFSMRDDQTRYALGSVLNQVLLAQSIIGLESKIAMEKLGEYPDIVIGCAGGGSNLGGLMAAFMQDKLTGKANPRFIAVEPASCPSLTRGKYAYDFCDTGRITPLAKMYTLGSDFMPAACVTMACPQCYPSSTTTATWKPSPWNSPRSSTPRSSSPNWSRSCPLPNPLTPSTAPSRRPSSARKPAKPKPSSSASPEPATST